MEISNYISLGVLVLMFIQLVIMFIVYKAENERKKKQSTIEYINQIRSIYKPIRKKLDKQFPGDKRVINIQEVSEENKENIREMLGAIEHLCVGLNTNVYDFNIFQRMSGTYFLNIFYKINPYILNAQEKQSTAYIEFEAICKKIEIEQKQRKTKLEISKKGNIKYS